MNNSDSLIGPNHLKAFALLGSEEMLKRAGPKGERRGVISQCGREKSVEVSVACKWVI